MSANSGDILVLSTIGVTESSHAGDEEFGELRLVDALLRHRELTAAEMAKSVVEEVVAFSAGDQSHGITLIVAKRLVG